MVRTQIQLPKALYQEVKRVAREREMSVAEVVRRGVEYITRTYPPVACDETWSLPAPSDLGAFKTAPEEWPLTESATGIDEAGLRALKQRLTAAASAANGGVEDAE